MKILLTLALLFPFSFVIGQTGCTDPLANNYDNSALSNDGSCMYSNTLTSPLTSFVLSDSVIETSGLVYWDSKLWTHNDSADTTLYQLSPADGSIIGKTPLSNISNIDWEDIAQNDDYLFLGDFGNNASGNRNNLQILRIEKTSIINNNPSIDTIHYTYVDQTDFSTTGPNNTDFDCESLIVRGDSIYLFTKQWVSNMTSIYSLPAIPGNYIANNLGSINVEGLITGATHLPGENLVVLCGYNSFLQPFIYLLYDFTGVSFYNGNKRKISIPLSFHQIEGITTTDGFEYYMTNERFSQSTINNPQTLHKFDLSGYLIPFLVGSANDISEQIKDEPFRVYPNPSTTEIRILTKTEYLNYSIVNSSNQTVFEGETPFNNTVLDISSLSAGIYYFRSIDFPLNVIKIVKK